MVALGDPTAALNTFLDALTALQECQYTNKLLPTLHHVAEAYCVLGETEKSREISNTISLMQEALEDAMKEKGKKSKHSYRVGVASENSDSGSLFLQKADVYVNLAQDLEKNGDLEQAIELAESVFRIHQYTLGPQNPTTVRSLRNLMTLYGRAGKTVHASHYPEPIIFTSVIKSSSCPQASTRCSYTEDVTQSAYPDASIQCSVPETSCSETSAQPLCSEALRISCADSKAQEGKPLFPCLTVPPNNTTCGSSTSTTNQDVVMNSQPADDKPQLECNMKSGPPVDGPTCCTALTHSLRLFSDTASFCTLFVVFSITTVAAISFYIM